MARSVDGPLDVQVAVRTSPSMDNTVCGFGLAAATSQAMRAAPGPAAPGAPLGPAVAPETLSLGPSWSSRWLARFARRTPALAMR